MEVDTSLVGLIGAPPVAVVVPEGLVEVVIAVVLDDDGRGAQELRAHIRSVEQQPPPKEEGQDWTFNGQAVVVDVEVIVFTAVLVRVDADAVTVKSCVMI